MLHHVCPEMPVILIVFCVCPQVLKLLDRGRIICHMYLYGCVCRLQLLLYDCVRDICRAMSLSFLHEAVPGEALLGKTVVDAAPDGGTVVWTPRRTA